MQETSVVELIEGRLNSDALELPVFNRKGGIRHDGGVVVDAPGLYYLGATFLRRRKSSFIHGAGDDARDLSEHLAAFLTGRPAD